MDYKQYKDTVYKIIGAAMSVQIPDKTKTIQNPLKKRVVDTTPVVSVVESMMLWAQELTTNREQYLSSLKDCRGAKEEDDSQIPWMLLRQAQDEKHSDDFSHSHHHSPTEGNLFFKV